MDISELLYSNLYALSNTRMVFCKFLTVYVWRSQLRTLKKNFLGGHIFVPEIEYSKADANDLLRAVSDSGEIGRDARRGQLLVDTPQFQAICGAFDQIQSARLSSLRVENGRGVLVALSLDGLPLKVSRRWMLKNVTNARNHDQKTAPLATQWKLNALGKGPVTTDGRISSTRTRVWLNGQLRLEVALDGGAWELQFNICNAIAANRVLDSLCSLKRLRDTEFIL